MTDRLKPSVVELPANHAARRVPQVGGIARAMGLGATLYVPMIHPAIAEIVAGRRIPRLRSVVLCLEDALHAADVERGLAALVQLLIELMDQDDFHQDRVGPPSGNRVGTVGPHATRRGGQAGPLLFVRPRNLDMARVIAHTPGIHLVDGFVAPKIGVESLGRWWDVAAAADLCVMPTLEQRWVFDPVHLAEFGAALEGLDQDRLLALRLGGNDLLGLLGLRRLRGRTVYEGPLFSTLSQAVCQLGARGFPLTAPVFDIIDDVETLAEESRRDVEFGFVAKTAIHPLQVPIIEAAFAADEAELGMACKILAQEARAVFRYAGAMAEVATHRCWAERVVARSASYGVTRYPASDIAVAT